MKLTNKQIDEIEFLTILFRDSMNGDKNYIPTQEHIIDFVEYTSKGKGNKNAIRIEQNPLRIAKRNLDITVKSWIQDMREGLLFYKEILEDYDNHPYIERVISSIRKTLPTRYHDRGTLKLSILGFMNGNIEPFNNNIPENG